MLTTIATVGLGALMAAFAVFAVLLNEGEHASRRRGRGRARGRSQAAEGTAAEFDLTESPVLRDGRRMPVGDFLFGALYLRGDEPLPFAELANAAAGSGLDVGQTLEWVNRAEQGGLIERIEEPGGEGGAAQPAVRLTAAGLDVARNNRRGAPVSVRPT